MAVRAFPFPALLNCDGRSPRHPAARLVPLSPLAGSRLPCRSGSPSTRRTAVGRLA